MSSRKRRTLVHIVTVGLPHGGCNVAVSSSYKKAEELAHKVEDGLDINCNDIDIETWELNTMEESQDDGRSHDY